MFASALVPLFVERSCTCQVGESVVDPAVAPGAVPPFLLPYVIVMVPAAARVTLETVIVWPETETVPVLAVVYPASVFVVEGALQPAGTTRVTVPFVIPPVAAV